MPGVGQKRALNPLELEIWMSVNHRVAAGMKPSSSARTTLAINH